MDSEGRDAGKAFLLPSRMAAVGVTECLPRNSAVPPFGLPCREETLASLSREQAGRQPSCVCLPQPARALGGAVVWAPWAEAQKLYQGGASSRVETWYEKSDCMPPSTRQQLTSWSANVVTRRRPTCPTSFVYLSAHLSFLPWLQPPALCRREDLMAHRFGFSYLQEVTQYTARV